MHSSGRFAQLQKRSSNVNIVHMGQETSELRQTIYNIKDNRISALLQNKPKAGLYFHYNASNNQFQIEDPAVLYFLRNLDWERLRVECGYPAEEPAAFDYEVAISFAGEYRWLAEFIAEQLKAQDIDVFYDKDEDANLLGKDLSAEFRSVFSERSRLVVVLLDRNYSVKDWPRFEKEVFSFKVKTASVVPIFLDETSHSGIQREIKGFHLTDIAEKPDGWTDIVTERVIEPLFRRLSSQ